MSLVAISHQLLFYWFQIFIILLQSLIAFYQIWRRKYQQNKQININMNTYTLRGRNLLLQSQSPAEKQNYVLQLAWTFSLTFLSVSQFVVVNDYYHLLFNIRRNSRSHLLVTLLCFVYRAAWHFNNKNWLRSHAHWKTIKLHTIFTL